MKPFTVVIAVHGARECLELTLETLMAVGLNYIESIILVDSSYRIQEDEYQQTARYVDEFGRRHPNFVRVIKSKKRSHGHKIDVGISNVMTPYTMVLDSDVEFFKGYFLTIVYFMFQVNPKLFAVGHGNPMFIANPHYIQEARLYDGVVFLRTDVAKQYISKSIGFYRTTRTENRCYPGFSSPKRNIRVFYDTGGYLEKKAERDGFDCAGVFMNGFYYKHMRAGSYVPAENKEMFLTPLMLKISNKIWTKLLQEPFTEWS